MVNKKPEPAHIELAAIQLSQATFMRSTLIFLNYADKVSKKDFELYIKGGLLWIYDPKNQKTSLVPLSNVASAEVS